MSTDNPNIAYTIALSEHNFIVNTLNKNPLGASVMEVAALISKLNAVAQSAVDKIKKDEIEAAAKARAAEVAAAEAAAKKDAAAGALVERQKQLDGHNA